MNIIGWYRALRHPHSPVALLNHSAASSEPTELKRQEPMVVHGAVDMTHVLMPWHVLTHLTAIHLHDSPGLVLSGHEGDAFRGASGSGMDPVHFLGGLGGPHHLNPMHQQIGNVRSPPGFSIV